MRIEEHPILKFNKVKKIRFIFNGHEIEGYEGETIAAALHAAGVKVLGKVCFRTDQEAFIAQLEIALHV